MDNVITMEINHSKITSYLREYKLEEKTFLFAAAIQTYLRLTNTFFDYFDNKDISIIDYVKQCRDNVEFSHLIYDVAYDDKYFKFSINAENISEAIISNMGICTANVIKGMLEKTYVSEIHLLSEKEEERVYELATGEKTEVDTRRTWIDKFLDNVKKNPEKVALSDAYGKLTYEEVDVLSDKLANYLLKQGIRQGDFVAVRTRRANEFIVAMIGTNKAGAAYIPLDSEYSDIICDYIINNSRAKIILTRDLLESIFSGDVCEKINRAEPESLAYMIYTSGTTGNPKGVMIRHNSIMQCAAWLIPFYGLDETKRSLVHSSFSFDASTLDIFYPLIVGGSIYIVDEKTRMNLKALANYINENRITNFCASFVMGRELISKYDINVECVILGGEAYVPFKKAPFKIINGYGPTEFTAISSGHVVHQDKDYMPPIGGPAPGSIQIVLDCFLTPLPIGVPGELCLSGLQISKGYCDNEEATKRGFVTLDNGIPIYRTGDLVVVNPDNEFEYMGRIDRQMKVRGYRIEPAQIENKITQCTEIKECVVAVKKINGVKKLCLYYVAEKEISKDAIRNKLTGKLTDYMIPELIMRIDSIPTTRNGKTDYNSLPEITVDSGTYLAPQTDAEKYICELLSKILHIEKISIRDNFFDIGGDSISCMDLVQEIDLDNLDASDIYSTTNISEIAKLYVAKKIEITRQLAIEEINEKEYPLVGAQVHFYNIQKNNSNHTSCNLYGLYMMNKDVDIYRLKKALEEVLQSHYAFGTQFYIKEGRVYQKYCKEYIKPVEIEEISEATLEEKKEHLVRPYDIFNEQLYRLKLFKTEEAVYLFADFHHLIFDGYSYDVFFRELRISYNDRILEKDEYYRFLHNQLLLDMENKALPTINEACIMPYDFETKREVDRKNCRDFYKVKCPFTSETVEKICEKYNVTQNVFFMGAYLLSMYKYNHSREQSISWIYNGRDTRYSVDCIGLMINLLFINQKIDEDMSLTEFFGSIKKEFNCSMAKSGFNGYRLRDLLKEPISCFQYQDFESDEVADLISKKISLPNPMMRPAFFWEFEVTNTNNNITAICVYNCGHYEDKTVDDFMDTFIGVVNGIIEGEESIRNV